MYMFINILLGVYTHMYVCVKLVQKYGTKVAQQS